MLCQVWRPLSLYFFCRTLHLLHAIPPPMPAPQHHHGVKRKESETIQVQHETQGANKKPRVVWSVEMHQQVGGGGGHGTL